RSLERAGGSAAGCGDRNRRSASERDPPGHVVRTGRGALLDRCTGRSAGKELFNGYPQEDCAGENSGRPARPVKKAQLFRQATADARRRRRTRTPRGCCVEYEEETPEILIRVNHLFKIYG